MLDLALVPSLGRAVCPAGRDRRIRTRGGQQPRSGRTSHGRPAHAVRCGGSPRLFPRPNVDVVAMAVGGEEDRTDLSVCQNRERRGQQINSLGAHPLGKTSAPRPRNSNYRSNDTSMSKKLYTAFLPLLAVAAFAVLPAAAQAAVPHWYSCEKSATGKFRNSTCTLAAPPAAFEWKIIPESVPVVVKTTSSPTLTLHALGNEVTCTVLDYGVIENPPGGGAGIDLATEFVNSLCTATNEKAITEGGCPKPEILVHHGGAALSLTNGLPSELEEVAGVIRDKITGTEVVVLCENAKKEKEAVDVFNKGALTPKVGSSVLEFGAGSGELEDAATNKATVTGNDDVEGPAGDVGITAKTP